MAKNNWELRLCDIVTKLHPEVMGTTISIKSRPVHFSRQNICCLLVSLKDFTLERELLCLGFDRNDSLLKRAKFVRASQAPASSRSGLRQQTREQQQRQYKGSPSRAAAESSNSNREQTSNKKLPRLLESLLLIQSLTRRGEGSLKTRLVCDNQK